MEFVVNNLSDLSVVAKSLLNEIEKGRKIIAFNGEMGAGKTTLIKELCLAAGVEEKTSSPTFSIVNEYHRKNKEKIFHFDFYRIKNLQEAFDMGYEEYFYSGSVCLIEWPEKIMPLLPPNTLKVNIVISNNSRHITY